MIRPVHLVLIRVLSVGLLSAGLPGIGPLALGVATAHAQSATRPALTVTLVRAKGQSLPLLLAANGSVAAWQEAIIGAEINGLRLTQVNVNVGDQVRRGQVLAVFNNEAIEADIAQSRAALAEAEATLGDAKANAARAQQVAGSGALSIQQVNQYLTNEKTAAARVQSARAMLNTQQLRLKYTRVLASDDGVISARTATLGSVVSAGQELFRLIRQNRVEWRGEVIANELSRVKPGLPVNVTAGGTTPVTGKVRMVGPTVDAQSRNALVYVDLPNTAADGQPSGLRPGMFARGEFQLGSSNALTLPQEAVVLRDGFSYAFVAGALDKGQTRVTQARLQLGRRFDGQVEVLSGLKPDASVVASGASFLADGDTVRVVTP